MTLLHDIWDRLPGKQYVDIVPWAWVSLEEADSPRPFPFLGGVAPEVVASLQEAHRLMTSVIQIAISDVFARRTQPEDPSLRTRLEDAYAELVSSRPYLRTHIRCGRGADGVFRWEFPFDAAACASLAYTGLRVCTSLTGPSDPVRFDPPTAPAIGRLLGLLDGTRRVSDLQKAALASDGHAKGPFTQVIELLHAQRGLALSLRPSERVRWFRETADGDILHLGHATLLYRHRNDFWLFDPWLLPWFAEAPVPSPWCTLLPHPSAIFITHNHDDHMDSRTLLHMPKDTPVIVPSRANRSTLYYDYQGLLQGLGFDRITELGHGEAWVFDGGEVVSIPFYGEDPCDIEMTRNCYLIADRGRNTLVLADSGPANSGRSLLKEGVIDDLVRRYGPIATVFATQQQVWHLRTDDQNAPLSPPGRWLEVGENPYVTNEYLAELMARAKARLFVSYAAGGADWYPDYRSFLFSRRNPLCTASLTAQWDPPERLVTRIATHGCRYHQSHAFDLVRPTPDGGAEVRSVAEALDPARLFGGDP